MSKLLEIQSVSKSFESSKKIIDAMSLDVAEGEIIALVGESGCGKTTLLRMIAGFEHCDAGTIVLQGNRIENLAPEKRGIGMFFQDYALFPHLSVYDNITFGLTKGQKKENEAAVQSLIALAGIAGLEKRFPHELSGGQQQRVALLRALAPKPALLLLDEPFSNIDVLVKDQVRTELKRLFKEAGVTVVFVTHDIKDALYLADRLVLMRDGQVVQNDTAKHIYETPVDAYVASFMGKLNSISGLATRVGLQTAFGEIALEHSFSEGEEYTIYCRPEHLQVVYDADASNSIEEQFFLGNYSELQLKGDAAFVYVQYNGNSLWDKSKKVRLEVKNYYYWSSGR